MLVSEQCSALHCALLECPIAVRCTGQTRAEEAALGVEESQRRLQGLSAGVDDGCVTLCIEYFALCSRRLLFSEGLYRSVLACRVW
jgi:hypothetical protein